MKKPILIRRPPPALWRPPITPAPAVPAAPLLPEIPMDRGLDASVLIGHTITNITSVDDRILITTALGAQLLFHHEQDCCESVSIRDIIGTNNQTANPAALAADLSDLIGSPLIAAKWETSEEWPDDVQKSHCVESFTWTTLYLATSTVAVRVRWLGQSNGYYSETVRLDRVQ